ncbi:hypothetical protein B7463_g11719, partial [Scytalidium lignicola]
MKRLRLDRWSGQLLSPKRRQCFIRPQHHQRLASIRFQSTSLGADIIYEDGDAIQESNPTINPFDTNSFPSPPPDAALHSAKLGALHSRLSLPKKLPLQTLARTLVDPSADTNKSFNNSALAQVGQDLINYHVAEWLLAHYPRLPVGVLFAASYAYSGPKTLQMIGKEWGVDTVAAPGSEVDPGLLQFSKNKPATPQTTGLVRPDLSINWRRGMSSRIVYDDDFGDVISNNLSDDPQITERAYFGFVQAVVGAVYLHTGREAAKSFVNAHILSRHLPIASLFSFKQPLRDLSRLCAREDFEPPIARILSETGRRSRSPVFVVGIFSGEDKLGEGTGASLQEARIRAAVAALKAWYLYSPGKDVRVPSEMEAENAAPWEPLHIDIGEIV